MQDRVSLYPGRVTLTPVAGQENTYDMKRADQPTQEGDPLSKDTLLKDTTAALFGLGETAVPDDVFKFLSDALPFQNMRVEKITTSKTWVAPKAKKQMFIVWSVGGGGGGGASQSKKGNKTPLNSSHR